MKVAAWLIALTVSGPPLIEVPPPKDGVPQTPQIVAGLPEPIEEEDGTFLPHPLDQAVGDYIAYCVQMPHLCEQAMQNQKMKDDAAESGWVLPAAVGVVAGVLVTVLALVGFKELSHATAD